MYISCDEKIDALREQMKKNNIDAYIVPTSDFHGSEYVGDYFKAREFLSGFNGSAGTLVVTAGYAGLWTDGRYYLQAERQLASGKIELQKQGLAETPSIIDFLLEHLGMNAAVGFDGRCVSFEFASALSKYFNICDIDIVSAVWEERPAISAEKVFELDIKYCGESRESKLKRTREKMHSLDCGGFLLTSLDDIAWLLNLRGNDIAYNPVFMSYLYMDSEQVFLFVQNGVISEQLKTILEQDNVILMDYNKFYDFIENINEENLLLDKSKCNCSVIGRLPANIKIVSRMNPTSYFKSIKNKTEIENERQAHIKDATALIKFIKWLYDTVGKERITEMWAAEKLEEFRKEDKSYLGASFAPICAYKKHGAIVHYSPTFGTNSFISDNSFLLLDTGGQYLEGTTDITRTIPMTFNLTEQQKTDYTLVLKGHLRLLNLKFPKGTYGYALDSVARSPLWQHGLDYNHGTGHGVGYYLNVHESPNSFTARKSALKDVVAFEAGMITSDEPGLYRAGEYGIRHENLILCSEYKTTEFGEFLQFEPLSLVPFEKNAIDFSLLSDDEKQTLSNYNKLIYQKVSPCLDEEHRKWLEEQTNY